MNSFASTSRVFVALMLSLCGVLAGCRETEGQSPVPRGDAGVPIGDGGAPVDPTPDAGPPPSDGGVGEPIDPDAGAPIDPDGGGPIDPGPEPECEPVVARIGAEGGTLELCGARLAIPAGSLESPVDVRIERVLDVPAPAEPFELAGPAFRFSPESLIAALEIAVPHDSPDRTLELARLDVVDHWVIESACEQTDDQLVRNGGQLGTFVAIRDPRELPSTPVGLGTGDADVRFRDTSLVRIGTGTSGYAAEEIRLDGHRVLSARFEGPIGQTLEVRMVRYADGGSAALSVEWRDPLRGHHYAADEWTWIDPPEGQLEELADGSLVGWVRATVHSYEAGDAFPIGLEIRVRPEPWRREPTRVCSTDGE